MTLEQLEDRQFRIRNSVCHVSQRDPKLDYQMSSDMLALQETSAAKKYGEPGVVIKAATTIQRCWRKHYLNRTFHRIKLETPYRTKSMTSKVKPIVTIRQISASNDNLTDDVVRVSVQYSCYFDFNCENTILSYGFGVYPQHEGGFGSMHAKNGSKTSSLTEKDRA